MYLVASVRPSICPSVCPSADTLTRVKVTKVKVRVKVKGRRVKVKAIGGGGILYPIDSRGVRKVVQNENAWSKS